MIRLVSLWLTLSVSVDARAAPLPILYLAPRAQQAAAERVARATTAQVSDLDARLDIQWLEVMPDEASEQLALARAAVRSGAAVVFWAPPDLSQLSFFVAGRHEERLFVRRIDAEAEEPSGRAAVIALVIRSVVG